MTNNFNLKPIISILLIVILIFLFIDVLGTILIPFIVSLILTYILNPLVEKLTIKFKVRRIMISLILSILTFLIFLTFPLLIIPSAFSQLKSLIISIPNLIILLNDNILSPINIRYGTKFIIDYNLIKTNFLNNISMMNESLNIFSPIAHNSMIIIKLLTYVILIPFILFYSIIEWHKLINFFDSLIPKSYVSTIHTIIHDIDTMLSAYLRGQVSVMFIMSIYYATALQIIGLKSGIIIGLLTGLLVFIPYIGIICGLIFALVVGITNFHQSYNNLLILLVYGIGHITEGAFITPYFVGGKIGLNPIMIILALMIFGQLLGFVGLLLALPLSTITVVLLKHAKNYYVNTKYYNEE